MDFDLKRTIATIAPAIASALGTPVAGAAVHELTKNWLGDEDGKLGEQDIKKAVQTASPEQLASLKKIDNDFKTKMEQLHIDVFAKEVEDRKSARSMSTDDKWPQFVLTLLILVGFFAALVCLIMGWAKESVNSQSGVLMIGALMTSFGASIQFWFGSSRGSQQKDRQMAEAVQSAVQPLPRAGHVNEVKK